MKKIIFVVIVFLMCRAVFAMDNVFVFKAEDNAGGKFTVAITSDVENGKSYILTRFEAGSKIDVEEVIYFASKKFKEGCGKLPAKEKKLLIKAIEKDAN